MCLGILNFTKKYSKKALEECCKQALSFNPTFTVEKGDKPVVA
jgi:hypothetical protein